MQFCHQLFNITECKHLQGRFLCYRTGCSDPTAPKTSVNTKDIRSFSQLISFWTDTQCAGKKVLHYLKSRQAIGDILLSYSVNKKFLEFHHDITEECGAEDKQHSWAVIEKREEVVMYGPYYPNYNKGEHSEDTIIKQTQELLESSGASEDWKVYVFTTNSPCLGRNIEPCMLKLVRKAREWWLMFRVKTHVGFVKCWGFKGIKETLFRVVNYSQVRTVVQCENYEEYFTTVQNQTHINPLCENVYTLVKHLLNSGPFSFTLSLQGLEWKSYFKRMQIILESSQGNDTELSTQRLSRLTDAVQLMSSEKETSFEEHSKRGQAFALDYSFDSEISEAVQDQLRLAFQQCWTEMIQDKYTESIRETLTEDFNQCTNQLFIKDIVKLTEDFLHIGRIKFSEETHELPTSNISEP